MKLTDLVLDRMMEKDAAGLQLPAKLAKQLINQSVRSGNGGMMELGDIMRSFADSMNGRVAKLVSKPGKSLHYYSRARNLSPALQKRYKALSNAIKRTKAKREDLVFISDFTSPEARTAKGWAELLRKNKQLNQGWESLGDLDF
jgi:hypothetical protein